MEIAGDGSRGDGSRREIDADAENFIIRFYLRLQMINKYLKTYGLLRRLTALSLTIALMLCAVASASGTNAAIDARKEERGEVESKLDDVRKQLGENEDENAQLLIERRALSDTLDASQMEYDELLTLLHIYEDTLSQTDVNLEEAERDCDNQLELLKSRIRGMYMNQDGSIFEALLSSEDITSFMDKLELFSIISNHDNEILENYRSARANLEDKRSIQAALTEQTGERADEQKREVDALDLSREELEDRITDMQAKIDLLATIEDDLEAQSAKLENEIKELVAKAEAEAAEAARKKAAEEAARKKAAEEAARKKAAEGNSAQTTTQAASDGSGKMLWPAPGYKTISSPYGNRMHPIKKKTLFHSGIDIAAPSGVNIVAAKSGTVIISRMESGYGNTVVIDHGGGITTLYGHCSKLLVKAGQKVKAGETIAKVGSTGVSTGPHLHFEVRKNGSPVNPSGYL